MDDEEDLERLLHEFGIRPADCGDDLAPPRFDDLDELGSDDACPGPDEWECDE